MDILIRAKHERVEHKFEKNLLKEYGGELPDDLYCYWTGIHPNRPNLNKVMFTDGTTVYAEGKITDVDEDDGLCFEPLNEVNYPQPKKAPTRGFTYVA